MTHAPRSAPAHPSAIGSAFGSAMFLAGVVAAFVVLVPVYAVGALLRRLPSGGRARLRVVLHRPGTAI